MYNELNVHYFLIISSTRNNVMPVGDVPLTLVVSCSKCKPVRLFCRKILLTLFLSFKIN